MTPLRIELSTRDSVVVATLSEDIDAASASELGQCLRDAVPSDADGLLVDLSNVRYVDSAGVRMFFMLAGQLDTCRQSLGISLPDDSPVQRLMTITHMGEAVVLCSDFDECVEAMRRRR